MIPDNWMIMARKSSEKQARYFGSHGALRPYIFFIVDQNFLVDADLIKLIIESSYYDTPVDNVSYRKYFDLDPDDTFEFQFARMVYDSRLQKYVYCKFRKVGL